MKANNFIGYLLNTLLKTPKMQSTIKMLEKGSCSTLTSRKRSSSLVPLHPKTPNKHKDRVSYLFTCIAYVMHCVCIAIEERMDFCSILTSRNSKVKCKCITCLLHMHHLTNNVFFTTYHHLIGP